MTIQIGENIDTALLSSAVVQKALADNMDQVFSGSSYRRTLLVKPLEVLGDGVYISIAAC